MSADPLTPAAPGPLDPATWAADYVLAALGVERAPLLIAALTAGWLSDEERAALRPLALGVAYLAGLPAPEAPLDDLEAGERLNEAILEQYGRHPAEGDERA